MSMPEDRRSPENLRNIIHDAIRETVPVVMKETLTTFGFDTSNPIALQQQQDWLRKAVERESNPDTKADRDWTRTQRKRCEAIGTKIISVVVGALTLGGVYAFWDGIKTAIKGAGS